MTLGYPSRAFLDGAEPLPDPRHRLTSREYEVLVRFAHGQSYAEIAAILGVSQHTLKHYARRVYDKLGLEGELGGWGTGCRLAAFRAFGWLKPPPIPTAGSAR